MIAKISDTLYHIGTNDRKKSLFENNWPLPYGIAYNSYLILDQKTALLDTIEYGSDRNYLQEVAQTLNGRPLDYLVIHHMEPDHAGMIGDILKDYPNVTIVTNVRAFRILESYFALSEKQHKMEVKDGSILDLGHHQLQFTLTPMLHWPESMVSYCTQDHILFSQDAFGTFGTLDGGVFDDQINLDFYKEEMLRYYSNIVGKYSAQVQKALGALASLPIEVICPVHGPIWRNDPSTVFGFYDKWSRHMAEEGVVIVYASMYGNTEVTADHMARLLAAEGIRNIRIYNVSTTHPSFILKEIWKYKGIILGSCSYNTQMHPLMQHLCNEIEIMSPKNKHFALFGGFSWSGGGLKNLKLFAERMVSQNQWQEMAPGIEIQGAPSTSELNQLTESAHAFSALFHK